MCQKFGVEFLAKSIQSFIENVFSVMVISGFALFLIFETIDMVLTRVDAFKKDD